ncbi:hypothetical protein O9G_003609 [Rozella allomycis CSF55]|uniref:Autophagy-related protein 16 domain-containing protein n=1 Tax=Rozella allomycis (strain CSF55) TaxID=988480 RepID=A0A075AZD8_ROZAC|nr:hypothetical protein O9G_003609 [Rozella allomycis CSF55]|eukprot:EPZ35665.1 hypothetical protein O9G_003609 [Rozella allomycis CSF55]
MDFLLALEERDRIQSEPFELIIESCNALQKQFARGNELENRINLLECILEERDDEISKLKQDLSSAFKNGGIQLRKELNELQEKYSILNEERLELFQQQHQSTQRLLSMNDEIKTKDLFVKEKVQELKKQIDDLNYDHRILIQRNTDNEKTILQLRDELSDERIRSLSQENQLLIDRWLNKMNEEVQTINLANEIAEERALKIENSDKDFVQLKREDTIDIPINCSVPTTQSHEFSPFDHEISCIALSNDSQYLAAASFEKQLIVYNLNTRAIQSITDVEFSPFDDCILAASEDQMARIWSLKDGRLKLTLTGHSSRVGAARFIEGGNRIITGSNDCTIKLWDLKRGYCSRTFYTQSSCNDLCPIFGYGLSFASGHTDNNLKFWDSRSSECVKSMDDVHSMPIAGAFASIDGKYLLTTSKDNTIKLVDPRNPDNLIAVAGSNNGAIFFWDVLTAKSIDSLSSHT